MRPVAHEVDARAGTLFPGRWVTEQRLTELRRACGDGDPSRQMLADPDLGVYRVEESDISHEAGHLAFCTTVTLRRRGARP